jgi:hypothetical protein
MKWVFQKDPMRRLQGDEELPLGAFLLPFLQYFFFIETTKYSKLTRRK